MPPKKNSVSTFYKILVLITHEIINCKRKMSKQYHMSSKKSYLLFGPPKSKVVDFSELFWKRKDKKKKHFYEVLSLEYSRFEFVIHEHQVV